MSPFTYILTTNGLQFLLSIMFWKFPPKKINNWYGYRTHKTMLNQKIWNFANTVFSKKLNHIFGYFFFRWFSTSQFCSQRVYLATYDFGISFCSCMYYKNRKIFE